MTFSHIGGHLPTAETIFFVVSVRYWEVSPCFTSKQESYRRASYNYSFPKWLFARLPHEKCIRLGSVCVIQVTSHLKCITCVQVSMYLRQRANSHDFF